MDKVYALVEKYNYPVEKVISGWIRFIPWWRRFTLYIRTICAWNCYFFKGLIN